MARQLSIIIPTLNEAGPIVPTLQALAPARRRGAEVIVVDAASRDATAELALAHADRVLTTEPGRATQLNAGAAAAAGAVLLFLHADSLPPVDFDQALLAAVADSKLAWGRFDVAIASDRAALRLVAAMMNVRSRASGIATGDQGLFATRALFAAAGGFPDQPLMEDIAFCRNAKRLVAPLCLRERIVTSGRRWERGGTIRTILLMWRLRFAYYCGADPRKLAARYQHVR